MSGSDPPRSANRRAALRSIEALSNLLYIATMERMSVVPDEAQISSRILEKAKESGSFFQKRSASLP
jgi:hypothetical protein